MISIYSNSFGFGNTMIVFVIGIMMAKILCKLLLVSKIDNILNMKKKDMKLMKQNIMNQFPWNEFELKIGKH